MKKQSRFITSAVATAKSAELELPWARGARREAAIARRKGAGPHSQAGLISDPIRRGFGKIRRIGL